MNEEFPYVLREMSEVIFFWVIELTLLSVKLAKLAQLAKLKDVLKIHQDFRMLNHFTAGDFVPPETGATPGESYSTYVFSHRGGITKLQVAGNPERVWDFLQIGFLVAWLFHLSDLSIP